mgnify:CR=1 FL=1
MGEMTKIYKLNMQDTLTPYYLMFYYITPHDLVFTTKASYGFQIYT